MRVGLNRQSLNLWEGHRSQYRILLLVVANAGLTPIPRSQVQRLQQGELPPAPLFAIYWQIRGGVQREFRVVTDVNVADRIAASPRVSHPPRSVSQGPL
jgi:hypothetical protein